MILISKAKCYITVWLCIVFHDTISLTIAVEKNVFSYSTILAVFRRYNLQKQSPEVFYIKKAVLKNFEIITHKKTPVLESLFNKVINLKACTFTKKRIPAQVFCWEYYEIFKNTYFENICKRLLFNLTSLFVCLLACFHRTLEKTTGRVGVYLKDIIKIL